MTTTDHNPATWCVEHEELYGYCGCAPDSWQPVSLVDVLAGNVEPPSPTVLPVVGTGLGLFYTGRTNALYGDTGAGKTWVALRTVKQAVAHGLRVVYVDLEDGPHLFAHRLRLLGVMDDDIVTNVDYITPTRPASEPDLRHLAEGRPALVVIDGVTGYYRAHGWEIDSAHDADVFGSHTRRLADSGACVLTLDHSGKSRDGRRWAIGSQHKLSAITGAAYRIEPAKGQEWTAADGGVHVLTKTKDRPGGIPVRTEDEAVRAILRPGHPLELTLMPGAGWLA